MSRHIALEGTLRSFSRALSRALVSEDIAGKTGFLQALDPRARLAGIFSLVIAAAVSRRIEVVAALFVAATAIAIASRVSLKTLTLRVWLVVLGFTGIIALPALFTTPGTTAFRIGSVTASAQGLETACLLILRVETAVTLTTALVLSTSWSRVLKALRSLGVPAEVVAMLAMTHRYIFLFIETAQQMFEARQSRILGPLSAEAQRGVAAKTAGVLMSKSISMGQDVYLAMQSRGFTGEVRTLQEGSFRLRDATGLAGFIAVAALAIWMGR